MRRKGGEVDPVKTEESRAECVYICMCVCIYSIYGSMPFLQFIPCFSNLIIYLRILF